MAAPVLDSAQALVSVLAAMPRARLEALLAGEPALAAPWVKAAAHYGLPAAQVRLGRMLLEGQGAPRDAAAALGWFRRAAETGDAEAQNMVGRCLEKGWGVKADPAAAAPWFRRAADQGLAWARYNLAEVLVAQGRDAEARPWLEAALAGAAPACRAVMEAAVARRSGRPC